MLFAESSPVSPPVLNSKSPNASRLTVTLAASPLSPSSVVIVMLVASVRGVFIRAMTSDEERIFSEADSDLFEEQPEKARAATTIPADARAPRRLLELSIFLDVFLCVCIYLYSALRLRPKHAPMRRNLPENAKPESSLVPFLVLAVDTGQRADSG